MELLNSTCLVTGGAGFIGSHLVDSLLSQGAKVSVLDDLSTGKLENIINHSSNHNFSFYQESILNKTFIQKLLKNVDIVFNLACLGVRHSIKHPEINQQVNAQGTFNVLEAAKISNVKRFIHCSSSEVYGSAQFVPMTETHPTFPTTIYGASKLAGEAYARAFFETYNLPVTIIRPFNTFGPRSHHEGNAGEVIPKNIVRALNGQDLLIYGDGSAKRDYTYVQDTVDGIIAIALSENIIGETLNIGSNFEITIKDLIYLIIKKTNLKAKAVHTKARPGDVQRLFSDNSKLLQLCNWKPRISFDDGLDKTITYFRDHPQGFKDLLKEEIAINWE